jgi:hypothetical protein
VPERPPGGATIAVRVEASVALEAARGEDTRQSSLPVARNFDDCRLRLLLAVGLDWRTVHRASAEAGIRAHIGRGPERVAGDGAGAGAPPSPDFLAQ